MRVLVADDDAGARHLTVEALRRVDPAITVQTVSTGDEVVPAMEAERPDLVLLDWHLPTLDGVDILRLVRGSAALSEIPVVIVTASAVDSERRLALEVGANDVITKPPSFRVYVAALRTLCDRFVLNR